MIATIAMPGLAAVRFLPSEALPPSYSTADHFALAPAILLALFACGILLIDFFAKKGRAQIRLAIALAVAGECFSALATLRQLMYLGVNGARVIDAFQGALTIDSFAVFFHALFFVAALTITLTSAQYLSDAQELHKEYFALLLFAHCGMFVLAAGTDLVTLFASLELMSLCFYVMVGFERRRKRSNEAALKYFLLGGFSSGLLAYGFSLFYGLAGSTRLQDITIALAHESAGDAITLLAIATTGAGVLFKISAVPFHMWAPDAYEGAPAPVTSYLSVASKTAAMALLLRLFWGPLAQLRAAWEPGVAAVAVATLTLGNFAALRQSNIKRLLAYSSIAHIGYMLLGLVAGNTTGARGILVYLLVYTVMTLGMFALVIAMRHKGLIAEDLSDLSGLIRTNPWSAVMMLILLLSLAGIPPTAGFWGKYYIFLALVEGGRFGLAALGAIYVALSLYYYFRIVRFIFSSELPAAEREESGLVGGETARLILPTAVLAPGWGLRAAILTCGLATLGIGLFPEPFLRVAQISLGQMPLGQ